jgi:alpha-L-rhamnosidase
MFGSVSEWFYRWLGGIRPDPDYPGFKRFTIAPVLPVGLDSVNCTYVSPYGAIVSKWWNHGQESQEYEITVPPETTASAVLPVRNNQAIQIIGPRGNRAATAEKVDEVHSRIRLKPGTYRITVRRSES